MSLKQKFSSKEKLPIYRKSVMVKDKNGFPQNSATKPEPWNWYGFDIQTG